jgi:hypothetical protein
MRGRAVPVLSQKVRTYDPPRSAWQWTTSEGGLRRALRSRRGAGQVSSGVRQREPPHPGSHLCYSSPVPIRCPCAGLEAGAVGQHAVPAPPAPCGTRSTEAADGGSGGAGYAVAMTALIAATSATTRVRRISFFTPSPFHVLLVLSAPGTYLRMRPREGRPLGTHGDVHLLPKSLDGTGSFDLPSGSSPAPT